MSEAFVLLAALAAGEVEVVDLSQPLSEETPVIHLPPALREHAGAEGSRDLELRRRRSRLGAGAGSRSASTSGRTSTRRSTGSPGATRTTSAQCPRANLIGPGNRFDRVAETEADPDYLLTVDDLNAWRPITARSPKAPGSSCAPAGTGAPTTPRRS